ncbi:hypothetical protein CNR37_00076 [Pseudomonas phage ventosus]|uniref:Uncharacterized protein n=1 Tax=Pseudomonas phage ventosus TaxID=2048980 RepID=A0A2H4P7X4_9CAUD|nr:hypothetical protein CNR37_00076 [Pseudomonas phage ventosus]
MKEVKNHPTGWMAFVAAYKAAHRDEVLTAASYKVLMQQYIKGTKDA